MLKRLLPAKRLVDKPAEIDFMAEEGRQFKVTVWIGMSQYYAEDSAEEAVINRVDKALYHAKETGRNRTCAYDEVLPFNKNVK
jgi:PleD family two-component response regulator